MLGIIIGIAAIISIVSTIKGTNEQIKNNLIGSGNNTVEVTLAKNGQEIDFSYSEESTYGVPTVSDETMEQILELETVANATSYTMRNWINQVYYLNQSVDGQIYGIDERYFDTCGYMIRTGRNFVEDDYKKFRKVLILNQAAADNLFQKEDPIGKTIEIQNTPFTVIGVVDKARRFEPNITNINEYYTYADSDSAVLYLPKSSWPIVYQYDEPENVTVRAISTDDMEKAGSDTAKILNQTISSAADGLKYKQDNLLEQAQAMQDLSAATNNQLIWIASISLLVGGIGVMNIMLVSVTERTSEIGLKKAIGAKKGAILGQFLTEAAVLTSLGGLLGVAVGIGMAQVINKVSGVAVSISVPASVVAVAFSMLIGIIFGLLPSVKAANLDPIEALRRE